MINTLTLHIIETIIITITSIILLFFHFKRNKYNKQIKNNLLLYNLSNKIIHISQTDFIALFKYNYNKNIITTHFMFSVDNNGTVNEQITCQDLPATINTLSLNVLKSEDTTLHEFYKGTMPQTESIRDIYKNTFKIYYSNLFKKEETPIGYITLSYSKEHKLSEQNKENIIKLINEIKKLI